ncbi:hypothetical protein AZI86_16470 [Bdellovibrio bacteriovorus]|uniref:Lysozyme inhibitor LprI N-terminal domain-containing protein n=1 Tax=Bdellovibrio bacteriovorus TaxID=959 RepID=A0A150WHN4_BDEBC|nr:hypothetical protein [Bdellovibrio bacteriovorus]KYG62426.1 hypothetical protein AZI86_16470 [Bdellovibrio bacteriovorus]
MKHLTAFVLFGLFLYTPHYATAQTGQGCHNWCGKQANNAATGYAASLGKKFGDLSPTERAEALRRKQDEWDQCKAQTIHMTEEQCNGQTSSADVPIPTANPNKCQTEYNDLVQKCDAQVSSSKNTCDETKNSAISNASSSASSSNTNTTGVTDSCNSAAALNSGAKNAWTSYRESCYSGMESCVNTCNEMITWANNNPSCFPMNGMTKDQMAAQVFSPKADQCLDLQAKVDSADRNIASYGTTADGADACKTETAGGDSKSKSNTGNLLGQLGSMAAAMLAKQSATATPQAVVAFCTANPTYPGCGATAQASCSDPTYAATNKVCQCAANPYSCRVMDNSASDNSIGFSSVDSSSRLPSQATNPGGDLPSTPGIAMVDPVRSGDVQGVDGRQGGAGVGSSTVGSGGGAGGLGKAHVDPNDMPAGSAGTFGGGGGGAGGRFGSQAGGARGGYAPGGGNTAGTKSPGTPDLRQFLPGGSFNPRQNNMIGGRVGIDGITGPNSNIWQKVQNRYQVLKDTLHP